MDPQEVIMTFAATLQADDVTRNKAEEHLKLLSNTPGYLPILLQIISMSQNDLSLCQCCSISLKKTINYRWSLEINKDQNPLTEEDRQFVKDNIIHAIANSNRMEIVKELSLATRFIAITELPHRWTTLFPAITTYLTGTNPSQMNNTLVALRSIIRIHCFQTKEKRADLVDIANNILPLLFSIAAVVLPSPNDMAGEILKSITKIFSDLNIIFSDIHPQNMDRFHTWMILFKQILDIQYIRKDNNGNIIQNNNNFLNSNINADSPVIPSDPDLEMKWGWWKVKKWIFCALNKIFTTYGRQGVTKLPEFAATWTNNYSCLFLESAMNILANRGDPNNHAQDHIFNLAINYVNTSIKIAHTYKIILSKLEFVMNDIIFKNIRMTDEVVQLWTENPVEYVRQENDISKEFISPRIAAYGLLIDLAKSRGKDVLPLIMNSCAMCLKNYKEQGNTDYLTIDIVFQELGFLAENIMSKSAYNKSIDDLFINYIIPEFNSPYGVLRGRACWIVERYYSFKFKNNIIISKSCEGLIKCLRDPDIPVQILAASAIGTLMSNNSYKFYLIQQIKFIMQVLLDMIVRIGVSELGDSLQAVLTADINVLIPDIVQINNSILEAFKHFSRMEDDESVSSSIGYLMNVECICTHMSEKPDILQALQPNVIEVLTPFIKDEFTYEFFENISDILAIFTYNIPTFDDQLWSIYPLVVTLLSTSALDFISSCAPLVENFISRSTDQFLIRTFDGKYAHQLLNDLLLKAFESGVSDVDGVFCSFLYMSFFLNCPTLHEHYLPTVLVQLLTLLNKKDLKQQYQLALIEVIETCLCTSFGLTQQLLISHQQFDLFILAFFNSYKLHHTRGELYLVIVFLINLFSLNFADWQSQFCQEKQHILFSRLVNAFGKLMNMKDIDDDDILDDGNTGYGTGYAMDDYGFDRNEDAIDPLEKKYALEGDKADFGDIDMDFYDFSPDDIDGYLAPLFALPIYGSFFQILSHMNSTDSARYTALVNSLDQGESEIVNKIMSNGGAEPNN